MTKRSANQAPAERLEDIDGIGRATVQALTKLGVDTVEQLAEASPDQLVADLAQSGHRASLKKVRDWVAEASVRAGVTKPAAPPPDDEIRAIHPPDDLVEGWTTGPGFTVWFLSHGASTKSSVPARRTIVYSERGPGQMRRFEGIETWVDWVRAEAGLADAATLWQPPRAAARAKVTLSDVRISREPGLPPAVLVSVDFDVAAVHDTRQVTVTTALVVAGTDEQVASATSIAEPGQGVTRRAVCALSFPPSGRYESRITVGVPSGPLSSFSGPELIVTE